VRRSFFHRLYEAPGLHTLPALVTLPVMVVVVGVLLTVLAFRSEEAHGRAASDEHLARIVERSEAAIRVRFRTYEDALISGTALFAASDDVSMAEWSRFTETLDLTQRYPGVNGIGVILSVAGPDRDAFLDRARASIDRGFAIRSIENTPPHDELFVITYIEPLAENRPAVGLDVRTETKRRTAAEQARDTGETAMTGRITLVQDATSSPGFLVYVPFYRRGAPVETVEQRREALQGFVFAPFVAPRFMEGVMGSIDAEVDLQIVKKDPDLPDALVYGQDLNLAEDEVDRVSEISLAGQTFELRFRRSEEFTTGIYGAHWIVAAGLTTTAALAAVVFALLLAARRSLRRALYAEDTARHRGDLVDLASHELRNPLAILSLSAEMLEAEASALGEPALQETAAAARAAAARAAALVSELLDLSRMDAQRLRLDLAAVRLGPAIEEAIALTASHWGERPVNRSGPPLDDGVVVADPERLGIVLRNLVDNAFKYSPDGTPVHIDVDTEDGESVTITVSDEGQGVAQSARALVFDRFSRGEATAHVGGLGIGLHLSRELARRMGGDLSLAPSSPGQGARFRLVLRKPATDTEALNAAA
jgi:signal transduction histidine kinase